jgi:hypothetical protein
MCYDFVQKDVDNTYKKSMGQQPWLGCDDVTVSRWLKTTVLVAFIIRVFSFIKRLLFNYIIHYVIEITIIYVRI